MHKIVGIIFLLTIIALRFCLLSFEELQVKNEEQHKAFFKAINLNFPFKLNLKVQVEAKNYYSAYLNITGWLATNDFFLKLKELFNSQLYKRKAESKMIAESTRQKISFPEEQDQSLVVMLYILTELEELYIIGNLSGEKAILYWQTLSEQISKDYKTKKIEAFSATRLLVASRLVFFKKSFKWKRKAEKFFKNSYQQLPDLVEKILKIYHQS